MIGSISARALFADRVDAGMDEISERDDGTWSISSKSRATKGGWV
jgi:hypothetical protein